MKLNYAVENIMTRKIATVKNADCLIDAMRLMVDRQIGCVIVTDAGDMVGILTERDVLKSFCEDPRSADKAVETVMSRPLVTIDGRAAIGQAAERMSQQRIRRLLVVTDNTIQGIVTERDLMRATIDVFNQLADAWV